MTKDFDEGHAGQSVSFAKSPRTRKKSSATSWRPSSHRSNFDTAGFAIRDIEEIPFMDFDSPFAPATPEDVRNF